MLNLHKPVIRYAGGAFTLLAALVSIAQAPLAAQVQTVDPNTAIDADLAPPTASYGSAPAPAAP